MGRFVPIHLNQIWNEMDEEVKEEKEINQEDKKEKEEKEEEEQEEKKNLKLKIIYSKNELIKIAKKEIAFIRKKITEKKKN